MNTANNRVISQPIPRLNKNRSIFFMMRPHGIYTGAIKAILLSMRPRGAPMRLHLLPKMHIGKHLKGRLIPNPTRLLGGVITETSGAGRLSPPTRATLPKALRAWHNNRIRYCGRVDRCHPP
jgi:hypothetical protein